MMCQASFKNTYICKERQCLWLYFSEHADDILK